jgi:Protein of unknown function (DUF3037)
MNNIAYHYQTIGYMHDVFTEEFLVMGVLVYAQSGSKNYLIRFASSFDRIVKAFPSASIEGLNRLANELYELCAEAGELDGGIRLSAVASGVAKSIEEAAEMLLNRLVNVHSRKNEWEEISVSQPAQQSSAQFSPISCLPFACNDADWEVLIESPRTLVS